MFLFYFLFCRAHNSGVRSFFGAAFRGERWMARHNAASLRPAYR